MTTIAKGANLAVPETALRAELRWDSVPGSPDVDFSALLLTAAGRVSSDADFVFYNQPQHASGSVRHAGKTAGTHAADAIEVDLPRVPPGTETVVLAASADGGTFGQVRALSVVLTEAASGAEVARFDMAATTETAFVAGELYRRNGAWKFRAVGQGYAAGLAGLATDYGISVEEPAAPAGPTAAAVPPSLAPPTAPPPTASPPTVAPPAAPVAPPAGGFPPPADLRWPATPPPPPASFPGPADFGPPLPAQPAARSPFPDPVPPATAASAPPITPPTPAPPPAPAATPAAEGPLTLDRGRVNLVKNQRVSLVKRGAPALSQVVMGLGWDPARGRRNIDLDASVIAFDRALRKLEIVWFSHLKAFGGALQHTGDNVTGRGDGDDEQIRVDLTALPAEVEHLVFTINSFRGQKFTEVARAFCRLVEARSQSELVRFDLSDAQPRTAVLMAALSRSGDGWEMRALGDYQDGRTVKALVDPAAAALRRP